ncbi:MAG TPA: hypothetical protein VI864_02630 [Candidatus Bathyarchaeia archaeon]|nr:hypothetical protein [Candidatus Bathyarchaeia archaeon]
MELEVEGVKYEIIPIPPSLSPYSTLIGDLLRAKPQTIEEVEKNSGTIAKAMEKLFAGTVKPTPKLEHQTQVFNALINLTNKTIEAAGLFRGDKGSSTSPSSPIEPSCVITQAP